MKLLQAARLSRLGDESTGIEKQDEAGKKYSLAYDHDIIAIAADTNVSGDTDPFIRPELGPWLTSRSTEYGGILASNLDRLGRNARHLAKLRNWAEDTGKKLIVINPPLQWPPETGDMASPIIWDVLARLAEAELAAITRRNIETTQYLNANNLLSGKPMFGLRIVKAGDKHKTLELNPELLPYLQGMVDRAMSGQTRVAIAEWLDLAQAPSSAGKPWTPQAVDKILRNSCLCGRRKDSTGKTVLRFDSLLTDFEFQQLQAILDAGTKRGKTTEPYMLSGIAVCGICGHTLYRNPSKRHNKDGTVTYYRYYRCDRAARKRTKDDCKNMVPATELERWLDQWFTIGASEGGAFGNVEIEETTVIPGHNHDDEISSIEVEISELLICLDDPEFDSKLAALRTERKRLRELPRTPDKPVKHQTGILVKDHWRTLDDQGKRDYLLKTNVAVHATKNGAGLDAWLTGDPNIVISKVLDNPYTYTKWDAGSAQ